ncbi:MAG: hypothetical protein EBU07_19880, partial [Betaproteobacteria bacterium]|nr:hypothetical protein [Betaproteobacteria bacterium]
MRRRARPARGFDSHLASLALVCAALAAVSAALSVNAIITSPLAQAARNHSVLTAQVRITGDPHEVRAKAQPQWDAEPMWVADATVTSVRVNRRGWNCATPVRLLMRAADATRMHMGQVWQVVARAAPSRVGDRSAAYLRVLAAPVLHADAPWWARAADSWRTGLRLQPAPAGEGGWRFGGAYPAACGELSWPLADP